MWKKVRAVYATTDQRITQLLEERVCRAFSCDGNDVRSAEKELSRFAQSVLVDLVRNKARFLALKMETRFNQLFMISSNGLPRTWKPSDDIPKSYLAARDQAEMLIDLFCYLRLDETDDMIHVFADNTEGEMLADGTRPKRILLDKPRVFAAKDAQGNVVHTLKTAATAVTAAQALAKTQQPPGSKHTRRLSRIMTASDPGDSLKKNRSTSLSSMKRETSRGKLVIVRNARIVMSSDECRIYISQFHRQAEAKYMQAIHDQEHSRIATRIPWYYWILLLALGWNEAWYVLKHPLLFLLFALIGVMYYMSKKLGIGDFVKNMFMRSIAVPFAALKDTIMNYLVRQVELKKREEELERKRVIADKENQEEMDRLATQARLDQSRNQLKDLVDGMPGRKKPVILTKRGVKTNRDDEILMRTSPSPETGLRHRTGIVNEDYDEEEDEERKAEIDKILNVQSPSSDDDGPIVHDS